MPKYTDKRPVAVFDTECYRNYWGIAFRDVNSGRIVRLRRTPNEELDRKRLAKILRNWRVVSFNGIGYDMPMVALAMTGATNAQLKRASDTIILTDMRPWQFFDEYGIAIPDFIDHIDLQAVSPGSPQMPSLKIYAGRLHSKRMQDLPFDVDAVLTDDQIVVLEDYHVNDLEVTHDKFKELEPQIELRAQMSEQYGTDLRSKSDAQVAEAVIKTEIERITGKRVYKPDVRPGVFKYVAPAYIKFQTPEMREILRKITTSNMTVNQKGVVLMPEWLEKAEIKIGDSVYRMGIGGLHSSESGVTRLSDDASVLRDRDVTSYYPSIILNNKLYPKHLGPVFLQVYRSIFERRVAAKNRAGELGERIKALNVKLTTDNDPDKLREQIAELTRQQRDAHNTSETLKIVLNGSFGKFGSPYSTLYSPNLMIQTTVTGQLAVLMLIEELELRGFSVVSANTDGFVTRVPNDRRDLFNAIMLDWEWSTGFGTEETEYAALYSRDVNNYISITTDGKVKRKGAFAPAGPGQKGAAGMKKNPSCEIATDAVIAYLKDGVPIQETIRYNEDIRKFVTVQRVTGGAEKDGTYIGKAIRWYYSTDTNTAITRAQNGNLVPRSMGAMPCLELPDEFPEDMDYAWYEREAIAILQDFGLSVVDPQFEGRTGTTMGHMDGQKTVHTINMESGAAVCGKANKTIRDPWVEVKRVPDGMRMCSKCVKGGVI